MDTRTGEIFTAENAKGLKELLENDFFKKNGRLPTEEEIAEGYISIEEIDMTEKQKENMQVSKHDSVSKLGQLFTGNRKERRKKAKEYRKKIKLISGD